jgi:hypothetical protein
MIKREENETANNLQHYVADKLVFSIPNQLPRFKYVRETVGVVPLLGRPSVGQDAEWFSHPVSQPSNTYPATLPIELSQAA